MSGLTLTLVPAAVSSPTLEWYVTRGAGLVALILLTASVVLGVLGPLRVQGTRWPRFAVGTLHRDVSLLALALLVVHIVTTVLDGYAPITLLDAVIPFASPYRPLWLGLGAIASDLLLALTVTSLIRRRLGFAAWRAIHWLAYACWPLAVVHGIGTGSDSAQGWSVLLTAACVLAVLAAAWTRAARAPGARGEVRAGAIGAGAVVAAGIAAVVVLGPLRPNWARRAGTPASLLHHSSGRVAVAAAPKPAAPSQPRSFSATLAGHIVQTRLPEGMIVEFSLRASGGIDGVLRMRLAGAPLDGGGLALSGSQVDLVAAGIPSALAGRVVSLDGNRLLARVRSASGQLYLLRATVDIQPGGDQVTGTLDGQQSA